MHGSTDGIAGARAVAMLIVIGICIGGSIGMAIGKGKGHGGLGFVLGALLGLIGWIIVACLKPAAQHQQLQQQFALQGQPYVQGQPYPQHGYGAMPQPSYGPTCRTCGGGGRWIQESGGWGCDRCKHMLAA
jgi:hypothetical protein